MQAVNLLPVEYRARRRQPSAAVLACAGVFVLLAALVVATAKVEQRRASARRAELAAVQAELVRAAPARRPVQPTQRRRPPAPGLAARRAAVASVVERQIVWDRVLRDLSLVLPQDVWLSSLSAKLPGQGAPTATAAPAPSSGSTSKSVVINGYTYSQEGVARLISRLALAPGLENVRLEKSSMTPVAKRPVANFSIVADLANPGGTR